MAILSKSKIEEIQKEHSLLVDSAIKEKQEESLRGGPMDSFKEAASFSVTQQARESRIKFLENILKDAKELPDKIDGDTIQLGKWFSIKNKFGIKRYRLVDPLEVNLELGLLSSESPLGICVLGKKKGEKVSFNNETVFILGVE